MLSITSGGAIPEVADYRVVLEGEETFIGTLNEDFAIESTAGDIFQLGNASWQIVQVGSGIVRVSDAKGAPPTIPFWLGEAPARSDELSRAVSDLRRDGMTGLAEAGIGDAAVNEIAAYLDDSQKALGVMPTQETLVLERFFDESGGMQLVLHAPFGSRINKAWGLALRKRFCRQFNFELQAAATEDAVLLSLGPQHSFPLADVFRYLHPATSKDILVQAFLAAPVFQTRWRWNTTISLAIPRNRNGRKIPPPLQRAMADDLMAAVFPDAAACPENLPGDRELPDHPLVNQVVRDCLEEAMDFEGLARVLTRIHAGEIQCVARDTTEPSPLCHEILNAKPYAFLDDAPLEERRTQAVYTRRATADDLGTLDQNAIERVRDEERPDPRDADELHDALLTFGFLLEDEVSEFIAELVASRRAGRVGSLWVAAERLPEMLAVNPARVDFAPPPSRVSLKRTAFPSFDRSASADQSNHDMSRSTDSPGACHCSAVRHMPFDSRVSPLRATSHSFIDPVSRETSRVSPSRVTAYSAGGADVAVPVNQISFPSGRHASPEAPRLHPCAIVTGAEPLSTTAMAFSPPSGSMNAMRFPSGEMRASRMSCGVS